METIEQRLRRIFKNAPHIYAECVRCAKERPNMDWGKTYGSPISGSHTWGIHSYADSSGKYWEKIYKKVKSGEEIGPDYPLPPDSPLRKKEVGNWYKCIDSASTMFNIGKWYKCIGPTNEFCAFINNEGQEDGWAGYNHESFDLTNPLPHNPETKPTLEDMEQAHQSFKTDTSDSNFIIKVDDGFCEWEYGFTAKKACIDDFICAIEETLKIKRDCEKMLRGVDTKPTLDMGPKPEQAPEPTQGTETRIQLNDEHFTFIKNSCVVHLYVIHRYCTYDVRHNETEIDQDNHETLLELQLEAVRFAKKRLSDISGNYSNN